MMSISSLGSSSAASSYYEVDDYYTKDNSSEHTNLSSWEGKGAELQGLSGPVNPEDFKRVLDGVTPDGQELGRVIDGKKVHRPGLDLTFSPPKSVAIMGQVFGDERIIKAHQQAVKETLSLVESFAAQTRVTNGPVTSIEKTNNLTMATFLHTSTRAQDPGFHTHAVISNMTLSNDGKWRSVSNEEIWNNSKARYGESYSMNLAKKLHDLGYEILPTGKNAEYEIAGVPKGLNDEFSTRSKSISKLLEERGLSGPKNREWAALQTRDKKVPMDKKLEQEVWRERAESKGYDLSSLVREAKQNQRSISNEQASDYAKEHVLNAVEHLSQRSATFSMLSLVQTARNLCIGKATDGDIKNAISDLKAKDILLEPGTEKGILTTRETIALENDNLLKVDFGKGLFSPMASQTTISEIADSFTLNPGQKENLSMVGQSSDRFMGSQGWAGVGKTHFAKAAKQMFEGANYQVVGLSPSAKAASELQEASGIESNTLASFIFQHRDKLNHDQVAKHTNESAKAIRLGQEKRQMIVVDESSFVSTKDMNKLMTIAEALDARVLKMGDKKQLGSVDAGAPFEQALDHGMRQENLHEIIRQKNEPLKQAVYDAINGNIASSISKIDVLENPYSKGIYQKETDTKNDANPIKAKDYRHEMRAELAKQAADEYLKLSPLERSSTALIVPSNEMRTLVNQQVRDELVQRGEIDHKSIEVRALRNTGLTDSQMKYAENYEVGNIVRFNTESSHHEIKTAEYFSVVNNSALMGSERYLELQSESSPEKTILIHPKEIASRGERAVEVFESRERELAAGDTVRWTRNDKLRGLVNTQTAQVLSVDTLDKTATLLLDGDKEVTLNMNELKNGHLDYNFSNTVHAAQGATVDNVITVAESWHKLLTNQRSFYVQISRAKHNVLLITDSQEKVTAQISNEPSETAKGLDLYENQEKSLDFEVVEQLKDALKDGVQVKDMYQDLITSFDGDKYSAQEHLQSLGVDTKSLEREIYMEAAINDIGSEHIESSELKTDHEVGEGAEVKDEDKMLTNEEKEASQQSFDDMPSWADFDSDLLDMNNKDQESETEIETSKESNPGMDMEI